MFSSLPLLPPPTTSLLPPLHDRPRDDVASNANLPPHQQQQQRRNRTQNGPNPRSALSVLAADERAIAQRKMAIAMYGYSWLKPAGCSKTMLGRHEEELEQKEVERQLREVEMQERNAQEMEEGERRARLEGQAAREAQGEDVGGERDLDEDVPDLDAAGEDEDSDEDGDDMDEEEAVDLDADVPDADADVTNSSYMYDTTREPDTGSEEDDVPRPLPSPQSRANIPRQPRGGLRTVSLVENHDQAEQAALVDAMIDEDELGEYGHQRDLDDDVPDMDADLDGSIRDLDDDVPDADAGEDDEDGGWEHTDTELEESDMDISILPPGITAHAIPANRTNMLPPVSTRNARFAHQPSQQRSTRRGQRHSTASTQSEASTASVHRRAGNMPPPPAPTTNARQSIRPTRQLQQFTPDYAGSDFSVSALISTGDSSTQPERGQRSWLDPASARRNLFVHLSDSDQTRMTQQLASRPQAQPSSGGLFTPPAQTSSQTSGEPRSRTRSGRVMGSTSGPTGRS